MKRVPARRTFLSDIFERPFSFLREFERSFSEALESLEGSENLIWTPNIEMIETPDRYEILVELPGMDRDDIKLNIKDNILTISGERKSQHRKDEHTIHYSSIWYGKFHTQINLPSDADVEKIKASYKNGMLKIEIPKQERAKAKEIEIKVEE